MAEKKFESFDDEEALGAEQNKLAEKLSLVRGLLGKPGTYISGKSGEINISRLLKVGNNLEDVAFE